jgi:hypothetical protein
MRITVDVFLFPPGAKSGLFTFLHTYTVFFLLKPISHFMVYLIRSTDTSTASQGEGESVRRGQPDELSGGDVDFQGQLQVCLLIYTYMYVYIHVYVYKDTYIYSYTHIICVLTLLIYTYYMCINPTHINI